jgi:glycosyltransferase involved in cell wall biosynthesis
MGLSENVTFYGHLDKAGMEEFWAKQNYLLSCSPHEGHPYNVMEAMARGIKPVIHNFYGADRLYKKEWLWNAAGGAMESIAYGYYDSASYREHVISCGWTLADQMKSIRKVLGEIA